MNTDKQYHLSIVVPAYNEAQNLPVLLERLNSALNIDQLAWEVIIVDDHSTDMTFSVIQRLAKQFQRVRGYRLSCNSGSHTAIRCGLDYAQGNCVAVIAADLQDSPEVLPLMIKEWR